MSAWLVAAALAVAGCGPTVTVHGERSRIATFARYRTYTWASPTMPARNPEEMDAALVDWRIRRSVDRAANAKGYVRTDGGGSLVVDYAVATGAAQTAFTDYFHARQRDDFAGGYTPGTLVLRFVDTRTGVLAYQASATEVMTPPVDAERLEAAVGRMLAGFPTCIAVEPAR